MFWIGCLCCWAVTSAFLLLADNRDWVAIWSLPCGILLCFPALAVITPLYLAYAFLIRPWRNVWNPVEWERFDTMMGLGGVKVVRLLPRLYFCFERKAAPANKIFFVRIRRDTGEA